MDSEEIRRKALDELAAEKAAAEERFAIDAMKKKIQEEQEEAKKVEELSKISLKEAMDASSMPGLVKGVISGAAAAVYFCWRVVFSGFGAFVLGIVAIYQAAMTNYLAAWGIVFLAMFCIVVGGDRGKSKKGEEYNPKKPDNIDNLGIYYLAFVSIVVIGIWWNEPPTAEEAAARAAQDAEDKKVMFSAFTIIGESCQLSLGRSGSDCLFLMKNDDYWADAVGDMSFALMRCKRQLDNLDSCEDYYRRNLARNLDIYGIGGKFQREH